MLRTTAGRLLVDAALPPDLRDPNRVLDKKGVAKLFQDVAERHPDDYREIAQRLSHIGHAAAYSTGGFSFGLKHMRQARAAMLARSEIERDLAAVQADPSLPDDEREKRVVEAVAKHQKPLEEAIYKESLAEKNPLALQVLSGTRGNPMNLKSLRGADLLYTDHRDNPIPVPVVRSYSQGLSPVEYWAGAYGARRGVIDTKKATADAGFFAKQLVQATHRLVVTRPDTDQEDPQAVDRGLPAPVEDPDNEGALLARPAGSYGRNTVLTPRVLKDLRHQGVAKVLVRSPMVGGPSEGGVYARDVGVRERGGLPTAGDFVGVAAAQALSEKLTQGQLSSKHTGGVAGAGAATSGFKFINNLVQVPRTFPGGAAHAQVDGHVAKVEPAPQGGHHVTVAGVRHYVPAGQDLKVAQGDSVEAGDVLSDGIPIPAEVVRHKGVGEGRRYWVGAFRDAYRNSGMGAHRRNIELLARGLIDHVRLTDEVGDWLPDDVVPYSAVERAWSPRPGMTRVAPRAAVGKYLERPVLHHTVGTKVRPGMLPELEEFGIKALDVHPEPPPFEPVMVRGMSALTHDADWLTRHLGSNLEKGTLEAVHRSRTSDTAGTSFVPALVGDPTRFGTTGLTKGWTPRKG